MSRSLLIALSWVLVLGMPYARAADEVGIGLFSIYDPMELEFRKAGPDPLKLILISADGQRRKMNGSQVELRCESRLPLFLTVDGHEARADQLLIQPGKSSKQILAGVPRKQQARAYAGRMEVGEHGGRCRLINRVGLEEYVAGVSCAELGSAGPEALKAQSILVRSWALKNLQKHGSDGFDFCDLTHCQTYRGSSLCSPKQMRALAQVSGITLRYRERLAEVAYFSTCGGHTADAADIWNSPQQSPHLTGQSDGRPAACSRSPHFRWRFSVERAALCSRLLPPTTGMKAGQSAACDVEVSERGRGGWVKRVMIRNSSRNSAMSGEDFHMLMGRIFGWGKFKSANFVVRNRADSIDFIGRGLGHGVGMCQHGAIAMDRAGHSHEEILKRYFPLCKPGSAR